MIVDHDPISRALANDDNIHAADQASLVEVEIVRLCGRDAEE